MRWGHVTADAAQHNILEWHRHPEKEEEKALCLQSLSLFVFNNVLRMVGDRHSPRVRS